MMKHSKPLSLFLCLAFVAALLFATPPSSAQRAADVERRVSALLAQMTLQEKLGQLQQLDAEGNGNFRPEHVELVRKGLLGSTLGVRNGGRPNQIQRVAVEESRLKIPLLFGFGTGVITMVGTAVGAGDKARARRELKVALDLGTPFPNIEDTRKLLLALGQ